MEVDLLLNSDAPDNPDEGGVRAVFNSGMKLGVQLVSVKNFTMAIDGKLAYQVNEDRCNGFGDGLYVECSGWDKVDNSLMTGFEVLFHIVRGLGISLGYDYSVTNGSSFGFNIGYAGYFIHR